MRVRSLVLLSMICLAMASFALASDDRAAVAQNRGPDNPANETITAAKSAIDHAITTLMANQPVTHAAEGDVMTSTTEVETAPNAWFTKPVPFAEFGFADTRDRRTNGMDGEAYSGNVGVDFLTYNSLAAGAALGYTRYHGHNSGINDNLDGYTGTLYLAGMVDPLYVGASVTKGYSWSDVTGDFDADEDSWTLAPFVGVSPYNCGRVSSYSALSYIARWQQFNYNRGITGDDANDGQFVLMNQVSYAVSERLTLKGILDINQVVTSRPTAAPTNGSIDHSWVTVGTKMSYAFDMNKEIYAGFSTQVWNRNYENYQYIAGLAVAI